MMEKRVIAALAGPTASGKTALAETLAHQFDFTIINIDSTLKFRFFDIGTMKPQNLRNRTMGIDTHHPFEMPSVADTIKLIEETPGDLLLVGGSLFYIKALITGLNPMPAHQTAVNEYVRHASDDWKKRAIGRLNISGDQYRAERELAMILASGRRREELNNLPRAPIIQEENVFFVDRPRPELHDRIVERTRFMLQAGLVNETAWLRTLGFENTFPMKFIGYRETMSYLQGQLPAQDLENRINIGTNRLLRAQSTWVKNFPRAQIGSPTHILDLLQKLPWKRVS